jgi:hypothetical protein
MAVRPSGALDVARLAATCNAIGSECADDVGFVPIRSLLSRFQAELIVRPLLVEAMIANVSASESRSNRWAILVDSERYSVSMDELAGECLGHPLPGRFRFTIAHELAHSLAFRPTEFGIQPLFRQDTGAARRDLVKAIEGETDRISPLLLLPDRTLSKLLSKWNQPLTANELLSISRDFGISRSALINRLMLLLRRTEQTGLREVPALTNVAIGIGEWTNQGTAVLRKWPLFINFRNGIVPSMLIKLSNQDRLPANSLIQNSGFAPCGGSESTADFTCDAGLAGLVPDERMRIRCTVESTTKRPGSPCVFVMSKFD